MVQYVDCITPANNIKIAALGRLKGRPSKLLVIRDGDREDDGFFLRGIQKDAIELGIDVKLYNELEQYTDGILYLGEPKDFPMARLDVDGMSADAPRIRAVAAAAMTVIDEYGPVEGKKAVVVGRGIGKQIFDELLKRNATVSICHSKTSHDTLVQELRSADIVVTVARGVEIPSSDIGDGALCVDIGRNIVVAEDDTREGDASIRLTPRKNGIGLITRAILLNRVAYNCDIRNSRPIPYEL